MAHKAKASRPDQRGSFRIIGGRWRGRRLDFVDDGSVRPSPDRVRETLFNWAMPVVRGARCLDLFAGSGALGLEALSRGADQVVFVDSQRSVTANIKRHLQTLGASAEVVCGDALAYLRGVPQTFDLVFIDPPYRQDWVPRILEYLPACMADGAQLYVEMETGSALQLPEGFELLKHKSAGQVSYHWVAYSSQPPSDNHKE